jgi:polyhydroxyalkanoate synthesis regulator protein
MPFELGIDYGLRRSDADYAGKRSLILETERYDYMKAISDINEFDMKNHFDSPEKLIECVGAWFSEMVKMSEMNGSAKTHADFIDFNTKLFQKEMFKYQPNHTLTQSERLAKKEIGEMTIPEFIYEIEEWKATHIS